MAKEVAKYKGMTFEYEREHLDIHELPAITHDDAKALLFKVKEILDAKGIDFYLCFGTLLGAVREKDFIKGDLDVDIYSNEEEKIFQNLQYLKDNGIELIRYVKNKMFSFRHRETPGAYIDIYVWSRPKDIWGLYCYRLVTARIPMKLMKETTTINFLGKEFKCVKNPENLLKFWYGDTWNTPIGKFEKKYKYDVSTHYYYKRAKLNTKKAIKKAIKKVLGIEHLRHKD